MQIRNTQQNIGFGILHIRYDKTKLTSENVKTIDVFVAEYLGSKLDARLQNSGKKIIRLTASKDKEECLLNIMRKLGATVKRTVSPNATKKAIIKDTTWLYGNKMA